VVPLLSISLLEKDSDFKNSESMIVDVLNLQKIGKIKVPKNSLRFIPDGTDTYSRITPRIEVYRMLRSPFNQKLKKAIQNL
jgi:hypothetical protein